MSYHFENNYFRPIDRALGRYIAKIQNGTDTLVPFSAATCSRALANGDTCIDLNTITPKEIWLDIDESNKLPNFPESTNWAEELCSSELVGSGVEDLPLTLIDSRLYLTRNYRYEQIIAHSFDSATSQATLPNFTSNTISLIEILFQKDSSSDKIDLQLAGALLPFFYRYSILSGGPGTGKTTTVVKMLSIALSHTPELSIALAAPTGKAAQRMNESMAGGISRLTIPSSISEKLKKLEASTIHRLLGTIHNRSSFRHNADNPLPYDLLIIDEASMIDLSMMAKLISALKPSTQLILLGDQYQLASVEAGTVLGDLCDRYGVNQFSEQFLNLYNTFGSGDNSTETGTLSPVIKLIKSHRFDESSMVGNISRKINSDDLVKSAIQELTQEGEVQRKDSFSLSDITERYISLIKSGSPTEALVNNRNSIILTANNNGIWGQETINEQIIEHFRKNKSSRLFRNMPIMVTANSYNTGLFNGDIGVLTQKEDQWIACFESGDTIREIPLVLIPQWQPAFAITIHKSQGSEYEKVMILLGKKESLLFTKELLYTAITRAKPNRKNSEGSVVIAAPENVAISCAERRVLRSSGLRFR